MAAATAILAAHRALRFRPGALVEWEDDNGITRAGIVADNDGEMTGFAIGAPGADLQHRVAVLPCDPIYVPAAALRLI